MTCDEKTRLVSEYEMTVKKFSDSVSELQSKTGTSVKVEYDRLSRVSDELRLKSEQARLALEQHVALHGC